MGERGPSIPAQRDRCYGPAGAPRREARPLIPSRRDNDFGELRNGIRGVVTSPTIPATRDRSCDAIDRYTEEELPNPQFPLGGIGLATVSVLLGIAIMLPPQFPLRGISLATFVEQMDPR